MTDAPVDFVDMIRCLREARCEFVIVGAYALAANGHPRATQDIDILVKPDQENASRVLQALAAFGAPVGAHGVTAADFAEPGNVYQIGLPPFRIDLVTSIAGVTFEEAIFSTTSGQVGDQAVRFIGVDAQIRNKRAAGRTKDLADAEALEALKKK